MGSTRKRSKQKTHDHWMPDGWVLVHKKRKSGIRAGEEYKCFIEQSTGCKFYSKPEVLRYLKTTMSNSFSPESEQFSTNETTSEVRTLTSPKSHVSEQALALFDSTNESYQSHQRCRQKKSGIISSFEKNVIVEKQSATHLPPGWIRETKIRRTAKGIRRYPCYIEPVSGRVFHTKKKVLQFLEVSEPSRRAIGPKNQQVVDKILDDDKFNPSPASAVRELNHPSSRREAFIGQKLADSRDEDVIAADQSNKGRKYEVSAEINVVCMTTTKADCGRQFLKNEIIELSDTEENSDYSCTSAPLMDGSSIENLDKRISSVAGLIIPEADKKGKDNRFGEMEDTDRKTRSTSSTCKKMKNFSVCCRYSRRLAGVESGRATAIINNELSHLVSTEKTSQTRTMSANLANEECPKLVAVEGTGRASDTSVLLNGNLDGGIEKETPEILEIYVGKSQNLKTERIKEKEAEEGEDFTTKEGSVKLPEESNIHLRGKLLRRRTGKCDNRKSMATRSKNKKEDSLPCRSSKRLAGVEPELIGPSISCEKALEYCSKKPRSDRTVDLVSQQLEVGVRMEHAEVTSVKISKSTYGESLNQRCVSDEVQAAAFEKQERNPEAEIVDGEKEESPLSFSFGGSWSDPCLHIATKKLTGKLPVKETADVNPNLNFGRSKSENSTDEKSSKKANEMKTECVSDIDPVPLSDSKETTSDILPPRHFEENSEAPSVATKEQQQLQYVEVEPPQIPFSVRDSWSDPCIDFAIKTLTGDLSVEDLPTSLPNTTNSEANILQYKTCHQNLGEYSMDERNHIHLPLKKFDTTEEESMVFQPLKQQEHERERRGCTMPSNSDSTQEQGMEESFRKEAKGEGRSVGTSKHMRVEKESTPPEQINVGTEWQVVPELQQEHFLNPKTNTNGLHMPLSSSFLGSWSDPCLDFAIKTLEGVMPLEEHLPFSRHSLEMHTSARSRATSVVPNFGFPGFFRTDVSSYYVPDKFEAVKQSPLNNTPLVPPIDVRSTLAMHHPMDGRCSVESEPTWCMERRSTKSYNTNGLSKLMVPKGSVEEALRSLWDEERKGQDGRWCAGCRSMHMN